jgi:DNA-binding transcriptional MocR family regulator
MVSTIAVQAEEIGMGLYSLDRYPIAGNGHNGFAFGLGMIRTEQIDEAINSLAGLMRHHS